MKGEIQEVQYVLRAIEFDKLLPLKMFFRKIYCNSNHPPLTHVRAYKHTRVCVCTYLLPFSELTASQSNSVLGHSHTK